MKAIRLSKREKYAVSAAIAVVGIFILIRFVWFPAMDYQSRLYRTLKHKTDILMQMRGLQAEYQDLMQSAERLKRRYARRQKGFTLFSFLDRLARDTGIKDNIAYMKPSSAAQKDSEYKVSIVELKLQGINLKTLTDYLYGVETSRNAITIKRASITKTGKNKALIDAVLQVEAVEI
jgi:general secretion pathway protein M